MKDGTVARRKSSGPLLLPLALAAALASWAPLAPAQAAGAATPVMSSEQQRQAIERLPQAYRDWLVEVEPLITDEERVMFLSLTKDYQRDAFIQRFWEVRNRRPGARANEARERYAERLAAARARYGDLQADARARILLKNGEPDEVTVAQCASLLWPLEVWHYGARSADQVADEIYVVFYRRWHAGPFRLWDPGDGFAVLFADRGAGGQGGADLAGLVLDCRDGDALAKLLRRAGAVHPVLLAAFDARPAPVHREWVATFGAYSTDVPEGAAALAGKLSISYPGRRESRTVVQGVLSVTAAAAVPSHLGGRTAYDFLVTGEVLSGGALFESFRYRFDVPAPPPVPRAPAPGGSAAAAAAADSPGEAGAGGTAAPGDAGGAVPLVFERQLRPGAYTLVVKLEDLNSGRLLRLEQPLAVPSVQEVIAGAGGTAGTQTPAADPAIRSALEEANAALTGGTPAIKLVAPVGELQTGMTRFDALATGPGIDRVAFTLDGKPVFAKRKPPYSVELDLGTAPRAHHLAASAFNAAGALLATDELVVNSAGNRFRIKLVEPQRGKQVRGSLLARADVETPDGEGGVERVELYLGDTLAATLYQPPYEQAMVLPHGQALSYVRAVAYLADGSSTEDLVFVNAPEGFEQVNVQYVELYAALIDRHGRPVTGAAASRFTVLEDGVRQDLVRCERVSDLPIHAAVVLDTSASMESSLETARGAVLRFFETAIKPRDRAAVITFNDHPSLAVKFTNDQAALAAGLAGLKAERGTALYDTLVYAFYYFNGVKGQRAILLVTDGRDEDSRFSFEQALEAARRAGITLYAIGLGDDVEKHKLSRLCEETGGRAFFLKGAADLPAIYAAIQDELRAKVLLAYQSKNTSTQDAFRTVDVKLDMPGVEVKAPRGYYP